MSTPLLFKLTAAGQAAAWNASNTGLQVAITHVQLGSAPRTTTGEETALTTPAQLSPIAAGSRVSPSQIRLSAMFSGAQTYPIHEIGLWAGEPGTSGAVLFAYYAQATPIAHKSPGVDFIFTHDMALADAVASGSVTITTDPAASAMLALLEAHQQAADPHAQYIDQQRGDVRYAPLASPALTGVPTAPTAAQFDNDTSLATTAFVQRALGSFAGYEGYNANSVLTKSVVGKLVNMTAAGAAYTLTMPATADLPDGASFVIQNTSGRDNAIARQGTDNLTINGSSLTSLWVRAGEAATITKVGAYWFVSGSASLVGNASFAASFAGSGYQKLPSGLIIQWGTTTAASTTFPLAFPTSLLHLDLKINNFNSSVASSGQYTNVFSSYSAGFTVSNAASNLPAQLKWIAIGY